MARRILASFSGGRTSRYMTERLLAERAADTEILIPFANTGDEDERTLLFVHQCDVDWRARYGVGVIWLEALVNPAHRAATTHRVVTYESASRNQEPFREVIAKYGIPNKAFNHCNRELKLRPIHSYARSIGWALRSYETAIGIRADEIDRMSPAATKERWIYPMVGWGVTKPIVLAWSRDQGFDLDLEEENGNCKTCHKKSLRKLLTIMQRRPEAFAWRAEMEAEHPFTGAGEGPRRFYRGGWTTLDLRARARLPFEPFVEGAARDPTLDEAGACSESCDVFADQPQFDLFGEAA
jgi:hypothetical protein